MKLLNGGVLFTMAEARFITTWLGNGTPAKEHGIARPSDTVVDRCTEIYSDLVDLIGDCQLSRKQRKSAQAGGRMRHRAKG